MGNIHDQNQKNIEEINLLISNKVKEIIVVYLAGVRTDLTFQSK